MKKLLRRIVRFMEQADMSFADFRWFRRLHGGHWELWHVHNGYRIWFLVPRCKKYDDERRPGWLFGTPVCENWE